MSQEMNPNVPKIPKIDAFYFAAKKARERKPSQNVFRLHLIILTVCIERHEIYFLRGCMINLPSKYVSTQLNQGRAQ